LNDDVDFITQLLEEENMQAFPLSIAGSKKYQGMRYYILNKYRLLTCIKPAMVDEIVTRL